MRSASSSEDPRLSKITHQTRSYGFGFRPLFAGLLTAILLAGCGKKQSGPEVTLADLESTNAQTTASLTRLDARTGSKVRIEGTSTVHDWQVEGSIIGGFLEAGPTFPTDPGSKTALGKVEAMAEALIPVRSLKSVEKNGKKYSDAMDDIMYKHLKTQDDPKATIVFRLAELVLSQAPETNGGPYLGEAKGDLVVAGVTNRITLPVKIQPLGEKKIKISGSTSVTMTSFGIEPPSPTLGVIIKTGDKVRLLFDWVVGQKPPPVKATGTPGR